MFRGYNPTISDDEFSIALSDSMSKLFNVATFGRKEDSIFLLVFTEDIQSKYFHPMVSTTTHSLLFLSHYLLHLFHHTLFYPSSLVEKDHSTLLSS